MRRIRFVLPVLLILMMFLSVSCGGGGGGTAASGVDMTAPSAPSGLITTATSTNQINLSWSASTDNVGVNGYRIYRNSAYLRSVQTTNAFDTGLNANTNYCYQVTAYDAANNESEKSLQSCATTTTGNVSTPPPIGVTGWSAPSNIGTYRNTASYEIWHTDVKLNDSNIGVAVWQEVEKGVGSRVWSNRFSGNWGTPVQVFPGSITSEEPSVAIDGNGNAAMAWIERTTTSDTIWASRYTTIAPAWSAPVRICDAPVSDYTFYGAEPRVAIDSNGHPVAAWTQDDTSSINKIWIARYDGSSWTAPIAVSSTTRNSYGPQLATDGNNDVYLVWSQETNATLPTVPNIWTRIYSGTTGTWSDAVQIGSSDVVGPNDSAWDGKIAANQAGDALAVWFELKANQYWMYSSSYDKTSGLWSAPVSLTTGTEPLYTSNIAVDSAGNAVAAWTAYNGTGYDAWTSRYSAGTTSWSAPELIETDTQSINELRMDADSTGNAMYAWNSGYVKARRYTAMSGWGATAIIGSGNDNQIAFDVNSSGDAMILMNRMIYDSTVPAFEYAPYAAFYQP